jgi:predicted CXXCH cytochrome family protein
MKVSVRIIALTVLACVLALGLAGMSFAISPDLKKDCALCHDSHGGMAGYRLLKPPSSLCIDCHPERKGDREHRVDIVPSMPVKNLPLFEGTMTCVTCHEPHGDSSYPVLLRDEPASLCKRCHDV